ncbi:aldo/keto reductase [Pedobacter sp. SYSU D00535]|uniref:aldo/keto reductase n=1 Tax=Pedobacter sp. SYSU D00535 TaxID=2810308 RepID=UPI001A95B242|nr:aldo/keto reductase [Pedobacter sp. SYSU D00535]
MSSSKTQTTTSLPPVIFGTSGLGNLYTALDESVKCEIVGKAVAHSKGKAVFDSAGKYGAGLSLEALGNCLRKLEVKPEDVIISNKLGWYRTELRTPEPTFEPGVWRDIKHDAVQKISYEGILECFEQGNELLNGYIPQLVSVHDPDEYLATAKTKEERLKLYQDILKAYTALSELKAEGRVEAIGVGAKDWTIIKEIYQDVKLDWVMIANSMTVHSHPADLLAFMEQLHSDGVQIINSAVFNAGFLIGGDYYNYKLIDPLLPENQALFQWREEFFNLCHDFNIKPAEACVYFGLRAPGVCSIALSTTNPDRIEGNIEMAYKEITPAFWAAMKEKGLIRNDYKYV